MTGFRAASTISEQASRTDVVLETAAAATPIGRVENPQFFTGLLSRPEVAASALLAVADVAGTRYFDLGWTRSLDPVVTASGDRLRFESFSAENGVYARLDLLGESVDSGDIGFGTTNIDVNDPLRRSLTRIGRGRLVHLSVGADSLAVSTLHEQHVERQVEMPDRWIRGFAEVAAVAARLSVRGSISDSQIRPFLNRLPNAAPGPTIQLVLGTRGPEATVIRRNDSVRLAGTARLSAARRIARFCEGVSVYGSDDGYSAWQFELPGARFTLMLTPEPFRGFSGEGVLLHTLAQPRALEFSAALREYLAWDPVVDVEAIAADAGITLAEVGIGLGHLATSGVVGFDLDEHAWFHRELPVDPERALSDNPRLVGAQKLFGSNAVSRTASGWQVRSATEDHFVDRVEERLRCTCLWWTRYSGRRGPCKHALAVTIAEDAWSRGRSQPVGQHP